MHNNAIKSPPTYLSQEAQEAWAAAEEAHEQLKEFQKLVTEATDLHSQAREELRYFVSNDLVPLLKKVGGDNGCPTGTNCPAIED